MSIQTLHPSLVALDADATPEMVRGVLSAIFDDLPRAAQAKRYHELLAAEGFSDVGSLSVLDLEGLRACGIMAAHCALLLRAVSGTLPTALSAPAALPRSPLPPGSPAGEIKPAGDKFSKLRATAFPKMGACGIPTRGDFSAWLTTFVALVSPAVSRECTSALSKLLTDPDGIGAAWESESAESAFVWRTWVNAGSDGLPSALVNSIPLDTRSRQLGVAGLQWLAQRVMAVSDGSIAVDLAWFASPQPVREGHLLGVALARWVMVKQSLVSCNNDPGPVLSRVSLGLLHSRLPLLAPVIAALDVAHDGVIPVDVYLRKLQAKAVVYSSGREAAQAAAHYAESYGAQYTAAGAEATEGHAHGECDHWARNRCWVTDCPNGHSGPGGMHPDSSLHRLKARGGKGSGSGRGTRRTDKFKAAKAELVDSKAQISALRAQLAQQGLAEGRGATSPLLSRSDSDIPCPMQSRPSLGNLSRGKPFSLSLECPSFSLSHTGISAPSTSLSLECEARPRTCGGLASLPKSDTLGASIEVNSSTPGAPTIVHIDGATLERGHSHQNTHSSISTNDIKAIKGFNLGSNKDIAIGSGSEAMGASKGRGSLIADTGANVLVIGSNYLDCVEHERELYPSMSLGTANDSIELDRKGDLPHPFCKDGVIYLTLIAL
jgi:hypothetical protein